MAFFGDSITYGVALNYAYSENCYVNKVSEILGLEECKNNGISSTTFCLNSLKGAVYDRFKYETYLTKADGTAVDVAVIMAGVNDFSNAAVKDGVAYYSLGEFGSTDKATIYGSARYFCEKILEYKAKAKFKNTRFIICTPTITSWNNSISTKRVWDQSKENVHGMTLRQICNAIIETCDYYGVEVFDMNLKSGIYYHSETDNTVNVYFGDGIHPNDAGHLQIAKVLSNYLKTTYNV